MSTVKIYAAFFFLACVWGASFILMRIGVPEMGAPVFGGLRVAIAGLFLLPILLKPMHLAEFKANWRRLSAIGVISAAFPFMLFSFAAYELNAGTVSVINASVPMLTGVIAHLFFKDFLTSRQLLGLTIGFLGVVLLMYDGIVTGSETSALSFVLALCACFCYALGGNLAKRFLSGVSSITIAASGLFISGMVCLPIIVWCFPNHSVSWPAWLSVVLIAVVSTAIAMIVFYQLIAQIGPTKTSAVTLLVPLFALFFGTVFLQERLTLVMILGAMVVLSGTALTLFAKK